MDKESIIFLIFIIVFLLILGYVEFYRIPHRPIVFVIFFAVPITALIYKFLGGLNDSFFNTPGIKLTGSAAFLSAFIYLIGPIIAEQTIPQKYEAFSPKLKNWIPVDINTLEPVDLKLNYMNYSYNSDEFGTISNKLPLYLFKDKSTTHVCIDSKGKNKIGKIDNAILKNATQGNISLEISNSDVFLNNIEINRLTPVRTWFPYRIRPISFDNNTTTYQIIDNTDSIILNGDIKLRDSKIHKINGRSFIITIHGVNHETHPYWVRFAITELSSKIKL